MKKVLLISLVCIAFIAAVYFFRNVLGYILLPVITAAILAYLIAPLSASLEKRTYRSLAIILSFSMVLAGLLAVICCTVPLLTDQMKTFSRVLPNYLDHVKSMMKSMEPFLKTFGTSSQALLDRILESFSLSERINHFQPGEVVDKATILFVIPVLMFYMLRDRESLQAKCASMVTEKHRTDTVRIVRNINRQLRAYILGEGVLIVVISVLMGAVLGVFGFEYWLILGILMGIFNIIPYIGPFLGSVPILLVASAGGWQRFCLAIILIVAVQQVDNLIISPHIIGSSVKIHPAIVLLCVLIGSQIGSFIGMLLAIPVYIIIRILVRELYKSLAGRKQKKQEVKSKSY